MPAVFPSSNRPGDTLPQACVGGSELRKLCICGTTSRAGLQSLYLDIDVTATARFVSFQRYITHDCQSYSFQLTADTKRTFLDEYDALELHISSLLSISANSHD